jgi:pyruvate formate lyase activating enzyme
MANWWRPLDNGKIECFLCPRHCKLSEGQRAFCFVRQNQGGEMVLTTYGRSTGFCIDPIEKKPLNHFYPGSAVLSFGTAGCNLGCRFCQNWSISKATEVEKLSDEASPQGIARAAMLHGCQSVAFTYNDPVLWAEYAIDVAKACHELDVKTVAVTAGYITPEARGEFFRHMDAANVDLKAFTERFYHKLCFAHLEPVLETLKYLKRETDVWFEITTLVIPEENDSPEEIEQLCHWVYQNLGPVVPLHFTAYHPDFKMNRPPTPASTLQRARKQALEKGLKHVYTGNVVDPSNQATFCPACGETVIERDWYELGEFRIKNGCCMKCQTPIAGRFNEYAGSWGRKRMRVKV